MSDPTEARPPDAVDLGLQALGAGVSDWDLRTGRVWWTEGQERLFGLAPGGFDGRWDSFRARVSPDDLPGLDAAINQALAQGVDRFSRGYRVRRADNRERWIESVFRVLSAPSGEPARIVGIQIDVTDQRLEAMGLRRTADELAHRLKNTLSVVQAIARRSLRANGAPVMAIRMFEDRLAALAAAHDVLTERKWDSAPITRVVNQAAQVLDGDGARLLAEGPEIDLPPRLVVALSLALHELGTNALKHGALSVEGGRVEIRWSATDEHLRLTWRERDGPEVKAPTRRGFGMDLLERRLVGELSGSARLIYQPEGLVCEIEARRID
jgi:two-component sensor histidine kinase